MLRLGLRLRPSLRPLKALPLRALSAPPSRPLRENIYTVPNLLTSSRILACPVLSWSILADNYHLATGILVYAGLTDLVRARESSSPRLSFTSPPRSTATSPGDTT
jgi:cardiolipin synthase